MCNTIDPSAVERAVGYFDKRGDGHPEHFQILVAQCACEQTYWARVPGGLIWVEAAKEEDREPNLDELQQFSKEASNVRTARV